MSATTGRAPERPMATSGRAGNIARTTALDGRPHAGRVRADQRPLELAPLGRDPVPASEPKRSTRHIPARPMPPAARPPRRSSMTARARTTAVPARRGAPRRPRHPVHAAAGEPDRGRVHGPFDHIGAVFPEPPAKIGGVGKVWVLTPRRRARARRWCRSRISAAGSGRCAGARPAPKPAPRKREVARTGAALPGSTPSRQVMAEDAGLAQTIELLGGVQQPVDVRSRPGAEADARRLLTKASCPPLGPQAQAG